MTEQFTKATDRFEVQDDDGKIYTVVKQQVFIRTSPINQAPQTLKGTHHYELSDGSPVDELKDGTFKLIDSGKILRKI